MGSRLRHCTELHGCPIVLSRVEGPQAKELFIHVRPPAGVTDPGEQAAAVYRALLDLLCAEDASYGSVVAETVFLRDVGNGVAPLREARRQALARVESVAHTPATLEIGLPPLEAGAALEVSLQAVVPRTAPLRPVTVTTAPTCGCAECATAHGLRVDLGGETRFHAAGLCGAGNDAYEQTLGMFALAENLLHRAGMEFSDVVRTWIHLRHIDRDYAALNKARREFFQARGINPAPASTGIGGAPVSGAHDICLGMYAVKPVRPPLRTVMTSPTLNEASQYGADFVRGMRVEEANKVALLVSGTASLDEHGRTVHVGDIEAQADRMLVNIAALLERQGAGFGDVVSAITYLKHPADADRLRDSLRRAGFEGFPHAMVVAPICRTDLLCETEALAVLA